jgi:hypothetical protein
VKQKNIPLWHHVLCAARATLTAQFMHSTKVLWLILKDGSIRAITDWFSPSMDWNHGQLKKIVKKIKDVSISWNRFQFSGNIQPQKKLLEEQIYFMHQRHFKASGNEPRATGWTIVWCNCVPSKCLHRCMKFNAFSWKVWMFLWIFMLESFLLQEIWHCSKTTDCGEVKFCTASGLLLNFIHFKCFA